jgi:hypothetical protein
VRRVGGDESGIDRQASLPEEEAREVRHERQQHQSRAREEVLASTCPEETHSRP